MNITEVEKTAERIKRDGPFLAVRVSDDRRQIIAIRQGTTGFEIVAGLGESGRNEVYGYDSMTAASLAFVEWSGNPGTHLKKWIRVGQPYRNPELAHA